MDFQKILSQTTKKPKQILKIVLSFSVALLVIWVFLVSRMQLSETEKVADNAKVEERTKGLKSSLMQTDKEGAQTEVYNELSEDNSKSGLQNGVNTFLVMMGFLGLVWFWARNKSGDKGGSQESRDLGEHILGQGAQLKFVEINNEVWVLGMSSGSLNLLHRVPKSEWQESNQLSEIDESAEVKNGSGDFKSLYKFFKN